MHKTIEQILSDSQTAISNAMNNEPIKAALASFGYDDKKMQGGKALLTRAQNLYAKQVDEYGDKAAASQAMKQVRDKVNDAYIPQLKIARIAFKKNAGAYQALELAGKRKHTHAAWLSQARMFYTNALGDATYKAALVAFGITEEKLNAGLALVNAADTALANYKKEAGEAQEATEERDQALDELEEWMSDFIAIARIALAATPQKLEILGILARSE